MRTRAATLGLLAVMMLGGCGSPGLLETPSALTERSGPPSSKLGRQYAHSSDKPSIENALPDELVADWRSSSSGTQILYRFVADGTYLHIGVLQQARPSGTFTFTAEDSETAAAEGDILALQRRTPVKSLQDPDSPSSSYTNRPSSLEPQQYRWSISADGTVLTLDDGSGPAVEYIRE
jgi:hypothetical protein